MNLEINLLGIGMNFQRNCQQQLVILLRCTFGNKVPEFVRF